MNKHVITLAAIVAVAGASTFAFHYHSPKATMERGCATAVKSLMKSPSSFSVTNTTAFESGKVFIDYESANGYGTPIAGIAACDFGDYEGGHLRLDKLLVNGHDMTARGNIALIRSR